MLTHKEQGPQEYHIHYYIRSDIGTSEGEYLEDQLVSLFETIITADSVEVAKQYAEANKPGASYWIGRDVVQVDVTLLTTFLDNLREAKCELEDFTRQAVEEEDDE